MTDEGSVQPMKTNHQLTQLNFEQNTRKALSIEFYIQVLSKVRLIILLVHMNIVTH